MSESTKQYFILLAALTFLALSSAVAFMGAPGGL